MEVPEVDCAQAVALRDGGAAWIDVREQYEWDEAHIADTVHVPLRDSVAFVARELPDRDSTVVVSCLTGARSGQLVAYLREQGWNDVHNLRGGIRAWAREGRAIVT
jgi:rhodanese-related sulfurtransferase